MRKFDGLHTTRPTLWHLVVVALWIVDTILDGRSNQTAHDARVDSLVKRLDTPGML